MFLISMHRGGLEEMYIDLPSVSSSSSRAPRVDQGFQDQFSTFDCNLIEQPWLLISVIIPEKLFRILDEIGCRLSTISSGRMAQFPLRGGQVAPGLDG